MWRIVENHSLFRVFQNASAIMTIARASALRLSLNCIPYPQQILDLTGMGMYTVSFSETNPYIYMYRRLFPYLPHLFIFKSHLSTPK